MGIQAEKVGDELIAPMAQAHGFESRKQPALLFVEQGVEQQDGGFQFVRRYLQRIGVHGERPSLAAVPGQRLRTVVGGVDGGVEELAVEFGAMEALLLDQVPQGFLDFDMKQISQFPGLAASG